MIHWHCAFIHAAVRQGPCLASTERVAMMPARRETERQSPPTCMVRRIRVDGLCLCAAVRVAHARRGAICFMSAICA
eukprot:4351417-Prymnesium_polylepis.2